MAWRSSCKTTPGGANNSRECREGAAEQSWIIGSGAGSVRVANSNFCLDAGVGPKDGRRMKIWTCYEGLKQQNWFLTGDNRVAITNQGLCLGELGVDWADADNTNGSYKNGNRNQVWTPQFPSS
jgi:hypothetical protein